MPFVDCISLVNRIMATGFLLCAQWAHAQVPGYAGHNPWLSHSLPLSRQQLHEPIGHCITCLVSSKYLIFAYATVEAHCRSLVVCQNIRGVEYCTLMWAYLRGKIHVAVTVSVLGALPMQRGYSSHYQSVTDCIIRWCVCCV